MSKKTRTTSTSPFDSLYVPSISGIEDDILHAIQTKAKESLSEIQERLEETHKSFDDILESRKGKPKAPIKKEEIPGIKAKLDEMRATTKRISKKIAEAEDEIDKNLSEDSEATFVFHFKNKPPLKKAIKAITGTKKNFITYEDYKMALDLKKKLEQADADSFFEDDEEEK